MATTYDRHIFKQLEEVMKKCDNLSQEIKDIKKQHKQEIFELNKKHEEEVKKLNVENLQSKVKSDINEVCRTLPIYKKISEIEIRKEEFVKTTTNKIKR